MKELTILSGKGGTGKTSITAALATLAENAIICDNDVDAADLHLLLHPEMIEKHTFFGGWVVSVDPEKCSGCNLCHEYCRFDAISKKDDGKISINPFQCEGCRLCERVCPEKAIYSDRSSNNHWYVSKTRFGTFIHARMGPGEENSGKLVTQVRKRSKELAGELNAEYIINDGPPGIGCPAIASVSGTGKVLMVIEPTKSGLHDALRLLELVRTFSIDVYAVINKYDINLENTKEIELYLQKEGVEILAKLPFDQEVTEAMIDGKTIIEFKPGTEISLRLKNIWEILRK